MPSDDDEKVLDVPSSDEHDETVSDVSERTANGVE